VPCAIWSARRRLSKNCYERFSLRSDDYPRYSASDAVDSDNEEYVICCDGGGQGGEDETKDSGFLQYCDQGASVPKLHCTLAENSEVAVCVQLAGFCVLTPPGSWSWRQQRALDGVQIQLQESCRTYIHSSSSLKTALSIALLTCSITFLPTILPNRASLSMTSICTKALKPHGLPLPSSCSSPSTT
jgi:hypothetical protein